MIGASGINLCNESREATKKLEGNMKVQVATGIIRFIALLKLSSLLLPTRTREVYAS
jgi:hypothetical protein